MSIRIDLVTRAWIEDLPGVPADPENGIFDVQLDGGFILPGLDLDEVTTIETASQEQLDERAAFLAEQDLIAAARARLQALATANKSIAGDIDLIERGVLLPLGKALVVRSLALRTAANALKTPGATAAEVRTAIINYATTEESAEIAFLLAIKDIRDAITDREGV